MREATLFASSEGAQNALLYTVTVLIWGSTWLAIKFQLGTVAV